MASYPKLSIYFITYNHAQFVAKALDSVLMQRASFDYEIIIGDDCSTDGTLEIIQDYQRRWPEKIKALTQKTNVGMGKNIKLTLERCTGEYIACLEGDDYWTDPEKLRTQVEYLDSHPDCALVHHRVDHIAWPSGAKIREFPPPQFRQPRPDPHGLALFNYIQTCSVVFRRKWLPPIDEQFQQLKLADWPLCVLLGQRGWIGYINRTMAHYRIHANNSWNNRPADYKLQAMEAMARYLVKRVDEPSKEVWKDTILAILFKKLILAVQSLSLTSSMASLRCFVASCLGFKKPFWVVNKFWPYFKTNYMAARL
jgi:glycosyltransferase involved in cell wall biosynthesis